MNLEQSQQETRENNPELRRLHNHIQIELMKRWAIKRGISNHDAAEEWTEGRHFSGSFSELVNADPNLYSRYQADPESTLKEIEERLYGSNEFKEAA